MYSNRGPAPQPRHVPWPGVEPATFPFAEQPSINQATPVRPPQILMPSLLAFTLLLRLPLTRSHFVEPLLCMRSQKLGKFIIAARAGQRWVLDCTWQGPKASSKLPKEGSWLCSTEHCTPWGRIPDLAAPGPMASWVLASSGLFDFWDV